MHGIFRLHVDIKRTVEFMNLTYSVSSGVPGFEGTVKNWETLNDRENAWTKRQHLQPTSSPAPPVWRSETLYHHSQLSHHSQRAQFFLWLLQPCISHQKDIYWNSNGPYSFPWKPCSTTVYNSEVGDWWIIANHFHGMVSYSLSHTVVFCLHSRAKELIASAGDVS